MSWLPSPEAEELRAQLRKFLSGNAGRTQLRAQLDRDFGYDPALWRRCVDELGLTGLSTPEAVGGSDADLVTLGVVFEELGRALACVPLLATVGLATQALRRACALDIAGPVLEAITNGAVATLAWDGARPSQSALVERGGAITGTAALVLDGADAELLLVAARCGDGVALFQIDPAAPGLVRVPQTTLDTTRRIARLEFAGVEAQQLAAGCGPALDTAFEVTTLLLAAEQVGGARAVLEMAVEYAKTRIQFSRPIGSFQSIKHRCADMLVDVELAASLIGRALHAVDRDAATAALEASIARGFVSDAYVTAAGANIQIHGGIGFTWEHDAHLYLKRAKASQLLFGSPSAHRRRAAELLEISSGAHCAVLSGSMAGVDEASHSVASPLSSAAREVEAFLAEHPVASMPDRELRGARFDVGLAFVQFDEGFGGRGWDVDEQATVEEMFQRAGSPDWGARNVIGLGMAAPTIHAHGSDSQRRRLLRPLFTGEEIWCQLFSEPGAGSDLAALSTRAERVPGGWQVSGQKVWTTLAHVARWGLLLARTDPQQVKHRGISYFVLDMQAPGIEVRPLRQLTGEAEFNEVHLLDVFVPDEALLGEVGHGWSVAMTTLMNERVSLGGRPAQRGSGPIGQLVDTYRASGAGGGELDRVMRLWVRAEAARLTNERAREQLRHGSPGPEGSIAKLQMAELNKAIYDLCVELMGTDALLYRSYAETRPDFAAVHGGSGDVRYDYLRSLANSIEGGTSEVLRNVLGERVLGLAGEPRLDKNTPWADLPRS